MRSVLAIVGLAATGLFCTPSLAAGLCGDVFSRFDFNQSIWRHENAHFQQETKKTIVEYRAVYTPHGAAIVKPSVENDEHLALLEMLGFDFEQASPIVPDLADWTQKLRSRILLLQKSGQIPRGSVVLPKWPFYSKDAPGVLYLEFGELVPKGYAPYRWSTRDVPAAWSAMRRLSYLTSIMQALSEGAMPMFWEGMPFEVVDGSTPALHALTHMTTMWAHKADYLVPLIESVRERIRNDQLKYDVMVTRHPGLKDRLLHVWEEMELSRPWESLDDINKNRLSVIPERSRGHVYRVTEMEQHLERARLSHSRVLDLERHLDQVVVFLGGAARDPARRFSADPRVVKGSLTQRILVDYQRYAPSGDSDDRPLTGEALRHAARLYTHIANLSGLSGRTYIQDILADEVPISSPIRSVFCESGVLPRSDALRFAICR